MPILPILAFLKDNWKAISIILFLIAFHTYTVNEVNKEWESKLLREREIARIQLEKEQDSFKLFVTSVTKSFEDYKTKHPKTEYKEIIKYVTKEADANCIITTGFVGMHNAASKGQLPEIGNGSKSVDAPSGIALSVVANTVSDNYNICLTEMQKLKALQETVKKFQEIQGK